MIRLPGLPRRILRPFPQDGSLVGKDLAPLATRDLAHDVELLEQTERGGHGRSGQSGARREVADGADWMFDECLVHP